MKIEKINDIQIRCTLTKAELEMRDLKLSEIAYGSPKVKKLFRDMMQLAYVQCGFEAENIPLAIEVVPFRDYASITITKVEDPEELDTRYSRFAPGIDSQGGFLSELDKLFRGMASGLPMGGSAEEMSLSEDGDIPLPFGEMPVMPQGTMTFKEAVDRYFYFDTLEDLFDLAGGLKDGKKLESTLYRSLGGSEETGYLLELIKGDLADDAFSDICSYVSEFGSLASTIETFPYYITEHYEVLIKGDALERLSEL